MQHQRICKMAIVKALNSKLGLTNKLIRAYAYSQGTLIIGPNQESMNLKGHGY